MIKVSVVIPVYNVERYLPACLESVLSQSLGEIEVICIDDASPDRSGDILDEYSARDARVRVIHLRENRHQGYGRNLGMDQADGKYIYFLDSDDLLAPDALKELYTLAEEETLQGIFFDSEIIYDNARLARRFGGETAVRHGAYPDRAVTGPELFDLFFRQGEWTCYIQRQFWRLDFLRGHGIRFLEVAVHEDEIFPHEALLLADRVRYVRMPYFIRRYRENSAMTTAPDASNFRGYFRTFVGMEAFARRHRIRNESAERNMFRLSRIFERYYTDMHETCDLSAGLTGNAELLFHFYDAMRRVQRFAYELDADLKVKLESCPSVYVYGAGVVGKRAVRTLAENGLPVDGVVVSSMTNNPSVIDGHRVIPLAELKADRKNTVLLLAMSKAYVNEVRPLLEAEGWSCVPFVKM